MVVVVVVFIATNYFLAVAIVLPHADSLRLSFGRSAHAHQRLDLQWSAVTTISTAILALSSDVS
jgi:hypothetical protein